MSVLRVALQKHNLIQLVLLLSLANYSKIPAERLTREANVYLQFATSD